MGSQPEVWLIVVVAGEKSIAFLSVVFVSCWAELVNEGGWKGGGGMVSIGHIDCVNDKY